MSRVAMLALALVACEKSSDAPPKPPELPGVELATLAYGGHELEIKSPVVLVAPGGIRVDDKTIVTIQNGAVDPAEKEGGSLGIKIVRLTNYLAAVHRQQPGDAPLEVAIDKTIPYRVLVEVLFSAKQKESGYKHFELLARAPNKAIVSIPLSLPDKAPASAVTPAGGGLLAPGVGRINVAPPTGDESSLTPDLVLSKIQTAYMAGIKRCYKHALATDPKLGGKLTLSFTVDATGRVKQPDAKGMANVGDCVLQAMPTWRFPIPKDHDGNGTNATFQIALKLIADDSPASQPPLNAEPAPSDPGPAQIAPRVPDVPDDLKLVVAVTAKEIIVWSISGLEGTLQVPKLHVARGEPTAAAKVSEALAEIVKRRWPDKRPEASRSIMFMADKDISMATVVELLGAMRATPTGGVLFPDILLSSGFE